MFNLIFVFYLHAACGRGENQEEGGLEASRRNGAEEEAGRGNQKKENAAGRKTILSFLSSFLLFFLV